MPVLRKYRRDRYTITDIALLDDPTLSWKATGLLVYLLSRPEDWRISSEFLAERKTDGRTAVLSGLAELEDRGYLRRDKMQSADGRWRTVVSVAESPDLMPPPESGFEHTDVGFSDVGFPDAFTNTDNLRTSPIGDDVPAISDVSVRDTLFEAFYEFWTDTPYQPGAVLTKGQRGRINQAVADAMAAGITGDDVRKRGQRYRREWKDMDHTPQALLTHWHRFAEDSTSASPSGDGPIPGMTPPRNDPKVCRHRAMQGSGFCVGCDSQVAAPGKDGKWQWLPGMEPPGGRSMPSDRASPATEYADMFNDL